MRLLLEVCKLSGKGLRRWRNRDWCRVEHTAVWRAKLPAISTLLKKSRKTEASHLLAKNPKLVTTSQWVSKIFQEYAKRLQENKKSQSLSQAEGWTKLQLLGSLYLSRSTSKTALMLAPTKNNQELSLYLSRHKLCRQSHNLRKGRSLLSVHQPLRSKLEVNFVELGANKSQVSQFVILMFPRSTLTPRFSMSSHSLLKRKVKLPPSIMALVQRRMLLI